MKLTWRYDWMSRAFLGEPILFPMLVVLTVIWLLPHTTYPDKVRDKASESYKALPNVHIDWHPKLTHATRFSTNKTALYIEPRSTVTHITPLLSHMMEVVPSDWRFIFLGSEQTVQMAANSHNARQYIEMGRLQIHSLERSKWVEGWGRRWDDLSVEEMYNRLMTNATFYEQGLGAIQGTEYLFVFRSESILCANANQDLNDWLDYDWVGAPWRLTDRFGGNGGLSLRRISKVLEVLKFQQRLNNEGSEDQWLSARLGILRNANMVTPEIAKQFSVESIPFDTPMGYHVIPGVFQDDVWETQEKRKAIFEWCPEIKMILDMRLERERCP